MAARFVARYLFGLVAADPLTFGLATLLMLAVANLAGYLPALLASLVDPVIALRSD